MNRNLLRTPGVRHKPKVCATALKNVHSLKTDISRKRKRKSSSGSFRHSEQDTSSPKNDLQYGLSNNDSERRESQEKSRSHLSLDHDDHTAEDSNASNDEQDECIISFEESNNWTDLDDLLDDRPIENPQDHCGHRFPSYTYAAFSIFLAVSRLSRRSYSTLVQIVQHPNFSVPNVPSYSQAKRLLREVRTIPTYVHNLPVVKTNSSEGTSKVTTPAYLHSVTDIIKRAMESEILRTHMYFGAGQRVDNAQEFYHGDLWKESPLFGVDSVVNLEGTYEQLNNLVQSIQAFFENFL